MRCSTTPAASGAIDVAQLNIGNLLGSYLGHEVVPAQTREGAIGGQLSGAIGSLILPGEPGSLTGTILGTLLFNQLAPELRADRGGTAFIAACNHTRDIVADRVCSRKDIFSVLFWFPTTLRLRDNKLSLRATNAEIS